MERLEELTKQMQRNARAVAFEQLSYLVCKHQGRMRDALGDAQGGRYAPIVCDVLRSAVGAGGMSDPAWAGQLADFRGVSREWLGSISGATILGRLNFRRVPFATPVPIETAPASAAWVSGGKLIPMSAMGWSKTEALPERRIGAMVALTNEVFRSPWSPAIGAVIREAVSATVRRSTDRALIDPSIAASDDGPASLTNDVSPLTASGVATSDVPQVLSQFRDLSRVLLVMSTDTALSCKLADTDGRVFPNLDVANGGNIWGVPVVISPAAASPAGSPTENLIVAIDGAKVVVADDQILLIDASSVAAPQFTDAPTPGATNAISLFQAGATVLRLARVINFTKATGACAFMVVDY